MPEHGQAAQRNKFVIHCGCGRTFCTMRDVTMHLRASKGICSASSCTTYDLSGNLFPGQSHVGRRAHVVHYGQGNAGGGGAAPVLEEQVNLNLGERGPRPNTGGRGNMGGAQGENEENALDNMGPDWDDYNEEFPLGDISGGVQGLCKYISQAPGVRVENSDAVMPPVDPLPAFDASKQKVWQAVSVFNQFTSKFQCACGMSNGFFFSTLT